MSSSSVLCKSVCAGILIALSGCGLSNHIPVPPNQTAQPDFSITASPTNLNLTAGGEGQSIAVAADALHGFSENVAISLSGMPAGVTVSPSTATLAASALQNIVVTADESAPAGDAILTLTGTAGSLPHTSAVSVKVVAPDFAVSVQPASLTLTAGGAAESIAVTTTA